MSCMTMGVHLEDTHSPASQRWSDTSLKSSRHTQWTDGDLDAFVRQLSNPQHHVAKTKMAAPGGVAGAAPVDSTPKPSLEMCRKSQPAVGALSRSETDSQLTQASGGKSTDKDSSKSGVFMSGLRLIKNKKLARSTHSCAKKAAAQKAKEDQKAKDEAAAQKAKDECSASQSSPGVCRRDPADRDASPSAASTGSSSLEGSDGEMRVTEVTKDANSNGSVSGGKKRRFRRMLGGRGLSRSHSAGSSKDVPEHALFLDNQMLRNKKSATDRKNRASESDVLHLTSPPTSPLSEHDDETVDDDVAVKLGLGGIHKTKSADSAMLGAEGTSHKTKSRNIARKLTKKMQFLRRRHTDSGLVSGKDAGHRRLATVDPQEAKEWSKSFDTLLFDKTGLELFRGFLMSEHSDENIEFWIACENYKQTKTNKMAAMAHKIFDDYVAVQSRREVNIDSKTRTLTFDLVTGSPDKHTFDAAQHRVQALMAKDSYRRFLESEVYQDLAAGNIHHKS